MTYYIPAARMLRPGSDHGACQRSGQPTYHFRQHSHIGSCEWTLVLSGELTQTIGSELFHYGPGDVMFIREATIHELHGHHLSFINCPVRTATHQKLATACGANAWLAAAEAAPMPPVRRLVGSDLALARTTMQRAATHSGPTATAQLVTTLLALMTSEGPPAALPEWLREGLVEIDLALDEHLSVADLPDLLQRSAPHIARTFREHLACTPSAWLNRRRCERAASLMHAQPDLSLAELTYMVGFSSQSYFTRCFQHAFGVAPGRYQRTQGGV